MIFNQPSLGVKGIMIAVSDSTAVGFLSKIKSKVSMQQNISGLRVYKNSYKYCHICHICCHKLLKSTQIYHYQKGGHIIIA